MLQLMKTTDIAPKQHSGGCFQTIITCGIDGVVILCSSFLSKALTIRFVLLIGQK